MTTSIVEQNITVVQRFCKTGNKGLSGDRRTTEQFAEVEPFKTAIILKFARSWPFTLSAIALLVMGVDWNHSYTAHRCSITSDERMSAVGAETTTGVDAGGRTLKLDLLGHT